MNGFMWSGYAKYIYSRRFQINDYFKPFNNYEGEFVDPETICMSTDFLMDIFNQWGKHIISIIYDDELPYWDGKNSNGKIMNSSDIL